MKKDQKSEIAEIPQLIFCLLDVRQMDGEPLARPFLFDIGIIVLPECAFRL